LQHLMIFSKTMDEVHPPALFAAVAKIDDNCPELCVVSVSKQTED
ncbi:hypothetical protein TNCT_204191, partial [Trichonephila clavata]